MRGFYGNIIRHKNGFIKFPEDTRDVAQAVRKIEDIACFPNVVGAIDGSHISINAPHINHEDLAHCTGKLKMMLF